MENSRFDWRIFLTWILRLLAGGVFLFSGLTKAIDPWGTLYKVDDYLGVMGLDIWRNLKLVGVFGLCAIEFLTGIFLIMGCFRRSAAIMAAVIMAFMLPFSLWIAIEDPVADCGCFGDAFIISNWATFWKNVIISAGIIWLIKYNKKCRWLVTPALQWIAFVISGIFIVIIELFGYVSQPLIDFRGYKVGESLIGEDSGYGSESEQFIFIYEKDGVRKEFKESDELPDESEGWKFVDRKEIFRDSSPEDLKKDKTLRFYDKEGEEDLTEDFVGKKGRELFVMIPDLKAVSPATTWKLNSLFEWSVKNSVEMVGIVAGSQQVIDDWEDLSMASYPIYTADDTQIKEVVRGNPGIVYTIDGKIIWKSTLAAIDIDDFLSPETSHDASSFVADNRNIFQNCLGLYAICMAVLIFLSFTPHLGKFFFKNKQNSPELNPKEELGSIDDDKAPL